MAIITKTFVAGFLTGGLPAVGLVPLPIVTIREIPSGGAGLGPVVVSAAPSVENGDGFYRYAFASFDTAKNYASTWDGGAALLVVERTFFGATLAEPPDVVASAVWDELTFGPAVPDSFREDFQRLIGVSGRRNTVVEFLSRNAQGLPLTTRIRVYDSSANAALNDGVTGLLFSWTGAATPGANPALADDYTLTLDGT